MKKPTLDGEINLQFRRAVVKEIEKGFKVGFFLLLPYRQFEKGRISSDADCSCSRD